MEELSTKEAVYGLNERRGTMETEMGAGKEIIKSLRTKEREKLKKTRKC